MVEIDEKLLSQFYELRQAKKEIDDEINRIRKLIITYFDELKGENVEAEAQFGNYVVQRKIRKQEKWDREKTVERLKELGLNECIRMIEEPDEEKLNSAISLKFVDEKDLTGCLKSKYTPYISIEKYN